MPRPPLERFAIHAAFSPIGVFMLHLSMIN
jgi:hypothetical protein